MSDIVNVEGEIGDVERTTSSAAMLKHPHASNLIEFYFVLELRNQTQTQLFKLCVILISKILDVFEVRGFEICIQSVPCTLRYSAVLSLKVQFSTGVLYC